MDVENRHDDSALDNPIYLSEKDPATITKANLKPIGRSGTLVTADYVSDEYLPELQGVKKHDEFEKMLRSDSQVRKLYHAVSLPIKSATWIYRDWETDRKSTRLNSSHSAKSRMPSSA